MKFAVTRKSLPPGYLRRTLLKNLHQNECKQKLLKRRQISDTSLALNNSVTRDNYTVLPDRPTVKDPSLENQTLQAKKTLKALNRNVTETHLLTFNKVSSATPNRSKSDVTANMIVSKSDVTANMIVWTSQMARIKRKTQMLKQKDVEIRKRFEELQKKAKRVFSSTELDNENFDATPCKQIKENTELPKQLTKVKSSSKVKRRQGTPKRIFKKYNSASNVRMSECDVYRTSKSTSELHEATKENRKLSLQPNINFSEMESLGSPLLTIYKHGKRCTLC